MDLQDKNPQRRNLLLISVLTILYYLCDASIANNGLVKFSFISLEIHSMRNPPMLLSLSILWLIYRYVVINKDDYEKALAFEMHLLKSESYIVSSLSKAIGEDVLGENGPSRHKDSGFIVLDVWVFNKKLFIYYGSTPVTYSGNGALDRSKIRDGSVGRISNLEVSWPLKLKIYFDLLLNHSSIISFYTPIALGITAFSMLIFNHL